MSLEEELPNPDLTVKFLKHIEDVTDKVLANVTSDLSEEERYEIIRTNIEEIKKEAKGETNYIASVKPFFYGNEYYLFLHQEYKDIRLVGAPPSAIGKFGGDTDNWVWPRHTGDFSIFRIYADEDNNPAAYSADNVPYKPKKFLSISIKDINPGDFTWVMGYPGSTQEYLVSDAIELIADVRNPHRVKQRDVRLDVMNKYANTNDTIRIKYASKNARVSNSWKRWKGEIIGLKRLQTVEKKQKLEKEFQDWAKQNNKSEYLNIVPQLAQIYNEIEEYAIAYDYLRESILSIEIIRFASRFNYLTQVVETDEEKLQKEKEYLQKTIDSFFKDYVQGIDQDIFKELIPLYFENVKTEYQAKIPKLDINKDFDKYADKLYKKTIFTNKEELKDLVANFTQKDIKKIVKDPVFVFYRHFIDAYIDKVKTKYDSLNNETGKLYRLYVQGLQEKDADKVFYPDANFTMRISYGKVSGFSPRDAVRYKHYTTLDGVIEKDNPEIYDYDVPEKLKEIYEAKDYGQYEVDGTVPVCFIATNHTTGGNSGSPVLDAEGNLIGLNFDRAWDGIMSDMEFDPERSRNVTLDIRYLLFIVDKLAGASHLIEEMTIVK